LAVVYKATNLSPQNSAIDADELNRFSWEHQGSAQTDYRVYVYNNSTGALLHDSTKTTSTNEYYDLPALTLSNGVECKWYVATYSGTASEDSSYEFFLTETTPDATFTDPIFSATPVPSLTTQDYTFKVDYDQDEDIAIKRFKFTLYNSAGTTEIDTSDWVYEFTPEWIFEGMVNNTTYQIECLVETQDDIQGTTGKESFEISYTVPSNAPNIELIPNNSNGSIYVSWGALKQAEGTVSGGTSAYVTGKFDNAIDLEQGATELDYTESFNDTIYTFTFWVKFTSDSLTNWIVGDEAFLEFNGGNKKLCYDIAAEQFYYDDNSVVTYADVWTEFSTIVNEWIFIGITCDDIVIKQDYEVIAHIDII